MYFDPQSIKNDDNEPYRILDDQGAVLDEEEIPSLTDQEFVDIYSEMVFARHFDDRAINLQRQGRLGTYPPVAGHEAAQVASTFALRDDDWIFPTYRENAIPFVRDVDSSKILEYWRGFEEANIALTDACIFPYNIVVGGLIPHATGKAIALNQSSDSDSIVTCHFGDGASSEGDFHEGLNFAGVFNAPCVFICNNNKWAISVPGDKQTASETYAQKALAYGFLGVRVDGMDPLAVYKVMQEAIRKARTPNEGEKRPTLIESIQYRLRQHTTADDPTKYRDEAEVERWKRKDPIPRMENFLLETGRLDSEKVDAIHSSAEERMAKAIASAKSESEAHPDPMFEFVFEEPTPRLKKQKAWLSSILEPQGDDTDSNNP